MGTYQINAYTTGTFISLQFRHILNMVHVLVLKIHCNRNINDKLQQYENEVGQAHVSARGGTVLC